MWKKMTLVFALLSILVLSGCVGKPSRGDCVDVTKYGDKETTRYCKVAGNVQRVPNGYVFDL